MRQDIRTKRFALVAIVIAGALTGTAAPMGPVELTFEDKLFSFNADGVLPSSQGAVFGGTVSETAVFQVSGGLLLQDSTGWSGNEAHYTVDQIFRHDLDAVLEFRARVIQTEIDWYGGAVISIFDDIDQVYRKSWGVSLGENFIWCVGTVIPFNNTDGFHVYRLEIPANSDAFSFYVDGMLIHAGLASSVYEPGGLYSGDFYWGDGTPSAGNAVVQWDYVDLFNHPPDTAPPTVSAAASQSVLWPPNGKMRPVTISGVMFDSDSGLDPAGAGFVVLDEYGLVQPAGPVFVQSNGRYEVTIALEASRRGNDRDGRRYTVTTFAVDVAGNQGTASVTITVPHDQLN